MKLIILVAVALVAVAVAAPTEQPKIVRSDYVAKAGGGYDFNFETDNGILRVESGDIKEVLDEEKKPHVVVVQRGSYTYITPEGKTETINYFADETGYHAEGDSVPKEFARR